MSIGIIVCGQIRTFFTESVQSSFRQMLELCKIRYQKVHLVFVINDEIPVFDLPNDSITIIDYREKKEEYENLIRNKIKSEEFQSRKNEYFARGSAALKEVFHIEDNVQLYNIQSHQLQVGLDALPIECNVIMRTRFDMMYPLGFYPRIPESTESLINHIVLFPDLKERFLKKLEKYQLTEETWIPFVKQQKIKENCRVDFDMLDFSFGGHFSYPRSLENIQVGSDRILYGINDFYFFGKSKVFRTLHALSDEYCMKSTRLDVPHYYTPESQLCIFCDNHDISFIMYYPMDLPIYFPVR